MLTCIHLWGVQSQLCPQGKLEGTPWGSPQAHHLCIRRGYCQRQNSIHFTQHMIKHCEPFNTVTERNSLTTASKSFLVHHKFVCFILHDEQAKEGTPNACYQEHMLYNLSVTPNSINPKKREVL